jgi:2-polyprenyl-3-methyl-5-hydroxy-6-metoxy-1,4-benzoquinol methylase
MKPIDRATRRRIAVRFPTRSQRAYVTLKLATDPVYAAAASIIADTPLPLLDIGCGIGLLGHYLHAQGHAQSYLGLDHDEHKIAAGSLALQHAGNAGMDLRLADAAELPPLLGHVALLDVLHYMSATRQASLLTAAAQHLAPQGRLIIRNVLREPNWRFHATRIEEFFLRASGWIPGGAQHYPSADELRLPLESIGLGVRIEPLRGHTPFNSYLIVAQWR